MVGLFFNPAVFRVWCLELNTLTHAHSHTHTHTHVHAHSSSRLYITQQIKHTWAPKHMLNKMWIINYTKANKDQKLNGWSSRFCCRIICHLSKHDIYLNHCRDVSITELICTVILQHKPRCDFTLNLQMIFTMSTQNVSYQMIFLIKLLLLVKRKSFYSR